VVTLTKAGFSGQPGLGAGYRLGQRRQLGDRGRLR